MYPFDSPMISTSLSSSVPLSLDRIRSSDEILRSIWIDVWAFNDFTPIVEYNENARSDSSAGPRLPFSAEVPFDAIFAPFSFREKSTGSAGK